MVKDDLRQIVHLGDLFRSRKEPGVTGLPVLSVTMNDGLVHRDILDRKDDGKLAPKDHLLIRKRDLAYNMMRMWQGASGLAKQDGLVSPAYIVVTPSDAIDPTFAFYWFKSARMIHLFWAYSYGITGDRLRLYYKDFAKIPVIIPSKSDQVQIGKTLAAVDRAIARTEDLIATKRRLKKGLAQQLLTGRRRLVDQRRCMAGKESKCGWIPREWEEIQLGTLGTTYTGLSGKKKNDFGSGMPYIPYLNVFENTYIDTTRMDFVRVEQGERQNKVRYGDLFFTTSSETAQEVGMAAVLLQDVKETYLNSFCFGFRLKSFERLLPEFAVQLLRGEKTRQRIVCLAQGATRYNLSQSVLKELWIPLPPPDEQRAIASVLRSADLQVDLLLRKLAAQRQLKKGLMQQLLADELSVKTG